MPIQYSCVVCGTTILCSYQASPEPFEKLLITRLEEIAKYRKGKKTVKAGNYVYYTITENGVTFLCTVTSDFSVIQSYAFLIQVKTLFWQTSDFSTRDFTSAESHELDAEFVSVLDGQMETFSTNMNTADEDAGEEEVPDIMAQESSEGSSIESLVIIDIREIKQNRENVEEKVSLVKGVLKETISKEAGRLVNRTEELDFFVERNSREYLEFQERARRMNWLFRRKNRRMNIVLCIVLVVAVIVGIIIGILFGVGVL